MNLKYLPYLGVGLGFRPPYKTEIFRHRQQIEFLEITADHYITEAPEKRKELETLREEFTLIPHGLRLSLGSAEGIDQDYLEQLAQIVELTNPPWWSEHISFSMAGGIDLGHLAPLPFTKEALDLLVRNISRAQQRIHVPLILENITQAFCWPAPEMTEPEFLARLVERTGCGLLLDVTNLYTNSINHRFELHEYCKNFPWAAVVQLHFAGGHYSAEQLIDSHSDPTPPEVFELMEEVLKRGEVRGVLLERDENLPPFCEILAELDQARILYQRHNQCNSAESKSAWQS